MTVVNHDAFTKALQYMEEVRRQIEEVRNLNESICQDIALLVKKPWPTKTPQQPESNPDVQPGSKPSDKKALCQSDEIFSEEEQSVLAEVDSALAQAQKLRQFQKKNQVKQTLKETVAESTKPSHDANRTAESAPTSSASEGPHPNSENASVVPTNTSVESELAVSAPSDVAIISAKDLERLLRKDLPKTTAATTVGGKGDKLLSSRPSASRTKPLQPTRSQRPTSAAGRGGKARATSLKAAQYRTSSSEIGRHASRPGSSGGRGTSRQVQSTLSTRHPASGGKVPHHAGRNQNQNNSRQQQHPQQGQKRGALAAKQAPKVVGSMAHEDTNRGTQHQQKQDSARELHSQAVETETAVVGLDQLQLSSLSRTQRVDAKSPHSASTKQGDSDQGEGSTHFMLVKDGSSLSLPSRLKKLCQRVTKLQEQLSASYRKEERSSHAEWFLGQHDEEDDSRTDPKLSSGQLAAEFRHLIQLTKECKKQQALLSESPHWEDLYYLHTMARAIEERSKDLGEKLQQLREAEKGGDELSVLYDGAPSQMGEKSSTCMSPFIWPVDDSLDSQDLLCLSGGNILQYSSLRDLQDWARLLHQVQQVQLERRLQKVVGGAVLDLLEEANPLDPSFPRLYRVAHGVVLNAATVFPSMIADEGSER